MRLPNLIGCGAGKSGTTSLYHYLNQHPNIFMAKAKEVHFFSQHYAKGAAWYAENFKQANNTKIIGEFSTSYMQNPNVPQRMFDLLPAAKLLFVFRNPIERAYSNYWFSVSIGTQDEYVSFSEAIRTDPGYTKYVTSGFYYFHLQRFLKYYKPEKIHIILTEDLKRDPIQQLVTCYQFLEVDPAFQPDVERTYNVTVNANEKWKVSIFRAWTNSKKKLKPSIQWLPSHVRRNLSFLEKTFAKNLIGQKRPKLSNEDRNYLKEIYQEHNDKLAHFMDRSLANWNEEKSRIVDESIIT